MTQPDSTTNTGAVEVCREVVKFWGDPEVWGDFASLTSAAGKFAPIANKARAAIAGGEVDCLADYQMVDELRRRGWHVRPALKGN